jgi:hypothetical protein
MTKIERMALYHNFIWSLKLEFYTKKLKKIGGWNDRNDINVFTKKCRYVNVSSY